MTPPAPPALWPAPVALAPVDATVALPGSKSMTNRALVLAALAEGDSVVHRPLRARDTDLMAAGLRALGAGVDDRPDGSWGVRPAAPTGPADVDCGLAGTVMRFLPPVAALGTQPVRFDGDERARQRPLRPLLDALRALGAAVEDDDRGGLPLIVRGRGGVPGGKVALDASASSQLVSGLLLAAARFDRGMSLRHIGSPVPSRAHLDLTVAMLRQAGADVAVPDPTTWLVAPGPLRGGEVTVEPDLSNAAPFLAAALVTGGRVRVLDWPVATAQPGGRYVDLLVELGAVAAPEDGALVVCGTGHVRGFDADLRDLPEFVPVLAALAALADSPSRLRGVGHIRGHETDRLAALAKELNSLGGDVTETDDGLLVRPRPLHGGVVATYEDHRLATAAAVLGLAVPGVQVVDVGTTAKTMPDFVARWSALLGNGHGDGDGEGLGDRDGPANGFGDGP